MNIELKKRITGSLVMFGLIGSIYGFTTKAEGPASSTLKLILSVGGGVSLIAGTVMLSQVINNPPSEK